MNRIALEPERVAGAIFQFAVNPDVDLWGNAAQGFAHGGEFLDGGKRKELRYTNEVVDFCLGIIDPCHEDDPELCDRYVYLLAAATCYNGPATAAYRCLDVAAERAADRNQPEILLKLLELLTPLFENLSDENAKLDLYNIGAAAISAGTVARLDGNLDLARQIFLRIVALVDDEVPDVRAAAYGSLGTLHSMSGKTWEALQCLHNAERLLKPLGPSENLATTFLEIANVLIQTKEWERAKQYLEDAIEIVEPLESDLNLTCYPHCLSGLIVTGLMTGLADYDELLTWYDIAHDRALSRNDHKLQSILRHQFEDIQERKKPRPEAVDSGRNGDQDALEDKSALLASISEHLTNRLCVLAGAGVSYGPPASLPTAQTVLDSLLPALPIPDDDRQILIDATSPEWRDGIGYFDYLRFEQIMGALEYCGDYHGPFLHSTFRSTQPNENHYQLARLLDAGYTILTTNFDCLIEQACDDLGIPYRVLVTDADYEECIEDRSRIVNPIFKLHGTALRDRIDSQNVSATMLFVTTERSRMASKWAAVDQELADTDLLVVGYSGSDDFDVMPSIRFAPGKVAWVLHDSSASPVIKTMNENVVPPGMGIDRKLGWFFGRMFGDLSYMGRVKREPGDIIFARMPTADAFSQFVDTKEESRASQAEFEESTTESASIESPLSNDPSDQNMLLFVATLFRFVGMYEHALRYLDAALEQSDSSDNHEIALRIHASIARIWLDRNARPSAVPHMVSVLNLWDGVRDRQWQDKVDVWEFAHRLDSSSVKDQDFSVKVKVDEEFTPRQLAHLRRSGFLWKAELLLSKGLLAEASRCLVELWAEDTFPMELHQRAELQLLSLKIDRARKWIGVRIGKLECAEWGEEDAGGYQMMLSSATDVFELLQIKDKWADAIFMIAEEHMWQIAPHWSEEELELADVIYRKIGHEYGMALCAELKAHIDGIRIGATGAVHYRPADPPAPEIENDAVDFCQQCRSLEMFRFQHCVRCAWYSPDAPMSAQDSTADPGVRSEFLNKLHMAIGSDFLNSID